MHIVIPALVLAALPTALPSDPAIARTHQFERLLPVTSLFQDSEQKEKGFFPSQLDLSIPVATAQIALGLSPSDAQSPSSLYKAAIGYINGTDDGGLLKNGFSVSGSVQSSGLGYGNLGRYFSPKNASYRMVANTHISAALVRGASSDDPSTRGAIGVSIPLIDRTDWRFRGEDSLAGWQQLVRTYHDIQFGLLNEISVGDPMSANIKAGLIDSGELVVSNARKVANANIVGKKLDESTASRLALIMSLGETAVASVRSLPTDRPLRADDQSTIDAWNSFAKELEPFAMAWGEGLKSEVFGDEVEKLWVEYSKAKSNENWSKQRLDLAFALTWFSPDSSQGNFSQDGTLAWMNFTDNLGGDGQFTLMARYLNGDRKWNTDTTSYDRTNGITFGGRLRFGSASGGFFAEYLYSRFTRNGGTWTNERTIQIGYEQQVSDSMWLQISLGGADEKGMSKQTLFGLNLTYNLSKTRLLEEEVTVKKTG